MHILRLIPANFARVAVLESRVEAHVRKTQIEQRSWHPVDKARSVSHGLASVGNTETSFVKQRFRLEHYKLM